MANRGLSDEEVALAKGMINLGMQRDVIHSFFVSPGRPLTPAFVSEIHSGKIGDGIEAASESKTRAFVDSKTAFAYRVSRRSNAQLELFPEPPENQLSPHRFTWSGVTLTRYKYVDYTARGNARAETLLVEARKEFADLIEDSALNNHPRLKRRAEGLLDALPADIAYLNPVLAGARAKKMMQSIGFSREEFSSEFLGELSASVGSVLMLVSNYDEWRSFELSSASREISDSSNFYGPASELARLIEQLPEEIVEAQVSESLEEFLETRVDGFTEKEIKRFGLEVSAALDASVNYSALSTISQFTSVLIKEIRGAGTQIIYTAQALLVAMRDGSIDGVRSTSKLLTSSIILLFVFAQLRELSIKNPEMLGWISPFLDSLEEK